MKQKATVAATTVTLLVSVVATVANAGLVRGDPRVCGYQNARTCALYASEATFRRFMARRDHVAKWSWFLSCQPRWKNLLQWGCTYLENGRKGYGTVTFQHTGTTWRRVVRVKS